MKNVVDLAGKRAVVVGGTSGIGHGIALRLAKVTPETLLSNTITLTL
jgi:short-subunit dehydrogenase